MALTMSTPRTQTSAPTPAQEERLKALNSRASSLASEGAESDKWEKRWHKAYTLSLVFAAAAGVFSIFFQTFETSKAREGKQISDNIAEIGSERHEIEKQVSDFSIAQAQSIGSQADQKAQEAKERAGNVESANLRLRADLERATAESRAKQVELEKEQQKTAQAQKESADAQLSLKGYVERVAKNAFSRRLDGKQFVQELQGKPQASVRIWYKPDDDEAYMFAQRVYGVLGSPVNDGGAGWQVSAPEHIPSTWETPKHGLSKIELAPDIKTPSLPNPPSINTFQVPPEYSPEAPSGARFRGIGGSGLTLLCSPDMLGSPNSPPKDTAVLVLSAALVSSSGLTVVTESDPSLSDDVIILVVGQRR